MNDNAESQIAVNTFTGVFLLITGVAVFFMDQNLVVSLIIVLIGNFFLMRSLAQRQSHSE